MNVVASDDFPDLLRNGVWHTTHPGRFESILRHGGIIANPDIPDADRWKTNRGPDYYPYVRRIGGISLFEFGDFDTAAYTEACPMSSWRAFVPIRRGWLASIWLKIDPVQVNGEYFTPGALAERQYAEDAWQHTLMPRIEAAVVGVIPLDAIIACYIVKEGSATFEELQVGLKMGSGSFLMIEVRKNAPDPISRAKKGVRFIFGKGVRFIVLEK